MKRVLPFIILIMLVAAGIGVISYVGSSSNSDATPSSSEVDAIAADDWVIGNKDAQALLIEYSDFQCPACGAYHPLVKQLINEVGNDFAFVYRHFPLSQHKYAKLAAYASEAAGNQGKFWDMHAMIFDHQQDWSNADDARAIFIEYAKSLDIDQARFEADMDSSAIADKVSDSYSTGVKLRIGGTPTFFLNGKKLETPRGYEEFKQLIQSAATTGK